MLYLEHLGGVNNVPTKDEQIKFAKNEGNFAVIRNSLGDIKDAIRFMSLGTQFKDFLDTNLSDALTALYEIQHN